jgi:biopolymer transport protein ExbB
VELLDHIRSGGPVMIPIILASVVSMTTTLERMWSLRREKVLPRSFSRELLELVRQQRWGDALAACRKREIASARLAEVVIQWRDEPRERIKERIEEVGRRESAELERNVPILSTIGSIGTLLGLLGTVGGMIVTFQVIGAGEQAQVQDMAVGISQALVCTFSGLVVAIPSVLANRYFLAKIDGLTVDLEEFSLLVLDSVLAQRQVPSSPPLPEAAK